MLFGEYLVKNQLVTETQLLAGLITQSEATPNLLQILFDKKLLDAQQLLQVLKIQSKLKLGIMESCKQLGYWDEETMNVIEKTILDVRPPLGQILVEAGALTEQQLTAALDDYLYEGRSQQNNEVPESPSSDSQESSAITLDAFSKSVYTKYFSQELYQEICQYSDSGDTQNPLFLFKLGSLKGLAQVLSFHKENHLLNSLEVNLELENSEKAMELLKQLWSLRNNMDNAEVGTEDQSSSA